MTRMTMRAQVLKQRGATADGWGQPVTDFKADCVTRCFVWSKNRDDRFSDEALNVQELRAFVPLGTDVSESDRLSKVTDRRGKTLVPGDLRVTSVEFKHRHIELGLQRVDGS